ncbi:MAG: hypothetical protein ABI781_13695 [Burkholderiales bacterium]
MPHVTHSARITGPIAYLSTGGKRANIPLGPCLVEELDEEHVDIVWGARGERSTVMPVQALEAAEEGGNLVLLD